MIPEYFAVIGVVISVIGSLAYARDVWKGETQPNRVSFFIWGLAPLIGFAAQISNGFTPAMLLTFAAGLCPLIILATSYLSKHGQWQITRFDLFCGAVSFLAIVAWILTGESKVGISFSILADGLAAIPTLKKSYTHPESESGNGFLGSLVGITLALLTLNTLTFANSAFQLYLLVVNAAFCYLIIIRPRLLNR